MRIRNWEGASWPIIMTGIFFVFILQGCTEVTVKCGPGMQATNKDGPDGVGGCYNPIPYSGAIPAGTICKNINGATIQCPGGATCIAGSTKCNNPPGTDANRLTCKNRWTESSPGSTNGSCTCTGYY